MKSLNIPVEVTQPPTGMTEAVLSELAEHLKNLIDNDTSYVIDVNSLPLSDIDIAQLEHRLGKGEVEVNLNTIGESHIFETAYNGIWWVKHYTPEKVLISQFIEITTIPHIIKSQPEDSKLALSRLLANLTVNNIDQ